MRTGRSVAQTASICQRAFSMRVCVRFSPLKRSRQNRRRVINSVNGQLQDKAEEGGTCPMMASGDAEVASAIGWAELLA